MNLNGSVLGTVAFIGAMIAPQTAAHAWCATSRDVVSFWGTNFPDLRIPVWINISTTATVEHTGQTQNDVAKLVIEMIARHNESERAPKLYFAGFTTEEWLTNAINPLQFFPAGITVTSRSCTEAQLSTPCAEGGLACASYTTRGIGNMAPDNDPLGWIMILPPNCDGINDADWSLSSYADMGQVILHEAGHTLGLFHANKSKAICEAGNNVHGGPPGGTDGVMRTTVPAGFATSRTWRRDDQGGLDYLYGAAADTFEIAWWDDANYPDYPTDSSATSLLEIEVSRTAVASNRLPSGRQVLATTAPDGRVIHWLMNQVGDVSPELPDIAVDPSLEGRTWALPAVAMGGVGSDERIFIAWMANEPLDSPLMTLRTAVRSTDSLDWEYFNHPDEFKVNRLSAGYAASLELFVVTTLTPATTEVVVVLFDGDGAPLGPAVTLGGLRAFSVGGAVCEGAQCLIPFSESEFGGPNFGVAQVEIDPGSLDVSLLSVEVLDAVNTYGGISLLDDGQNLIAGMGERRFLLGSYPGLAADGTESMHNPSNDWALGMGLWGSVNDPTRRLFQARRVECGNGIVQGQEECDDANMTLGDGCSDCMIDDGVGEAGAETGTGDTAGGLDDTNGCECRADDSREGWLELYSLLGAFMLARSSRRRRRLPKPAPLTTPCGLRRNVGARRRRIGGNNSGPRRDASFPPVPR